MSKLLIRLLRRLLGVSKETMNNYRRLRVASTVIDGPLINDKLKEMEGEVLKNLASKIMGCDEDFMSNVQ